jgi:hypothetical protein
VLTSEAMVYFNETTRRSIPQVCHLHNRLCEDLKSYSLYILIMLPGFRVNHGSISASTSIAVTLLADVCIYEPERCSDTMFRK